jgi:hypothetical protein
MSFLHPYIFVIALSFLVSLTVYSKSYKGVAYLKLFPPFLFIVLVIETLTSYMASKRENNAPIYNFFIIFEFCFYLWLLSFIITKIKVKKIIRVTILIYTVTAFLNILFIQKLSGIPTITYSLGCLLIVSFCIYYFLQLFILPKSVRLWNNPAFWICFGLLFFYCCSFPLIGLINYWRHISKFLIRNFELISQSLQIFLYTLFMIAFLCIRTRKYTLSPS